MGAERTFLVLPACRVVKEDSICSLIFFESVSYGSFTLHNRYQTSSELHW